MPTSTATTPPLPTLTSTRQSPFVVARGVAKQPHKHKHSPTRRQQQFAAPFRPRQAATPAPSAMAFYRSKSNDELVTNLRNAGVVRSDAVVDAMRATDRAKYMAQVETPDGGHVGELDCYADSPHPIGFHQTISAPHMVRGFCISRYVSWSRLTVPHPCLHGVLAARACAGTRVRSH